MQDEEERDGAGWWEVHAHMSVSSGGEGEGGPGQAPASLPRGGPSGATGAVAEWAS